MSVTEDDASVATRDPGLAGVDVFPSMRFLSFPPKSDSSVLEGISEVLGMHQARF